MIQLDNKKKIFIILAAIIVVALLIFILSRVKNNKNIIEPDVLVIGDTQTKGLPTRLMTEEEKIYKVGIDPAQEVEVLKDQDGLYNYRLKNK